MRHRIAGVFPSRSQRAANSILAHALALGYTSGSPSADAYYAEQAAALGWTPGDRSLALTRSDGEAIAIAAVVVRLYRVTPLSATSVLVNERPVPRMQFALEHGTMRRFSTAYDHYTIMREMDARSAARRRPNP